MKKWTKSYLCMIVPFCSVETSIYREKLKGEDPGKIGGANAPPTDVTRPRKHGLGRVSAALVWPGGHTQLAGSPGLVNFLYLLLVVLFLLQKLTK